MHGQQNIKKSRIQSPVSRSDGL